MRARARTHTHTPQGWPILFKVHEWSDWGSIKWEGTKKSHNFLWSVLKSQSNALTFCHYFRLCSKRAKIGFILRQTFLSSPTSSHRGWIWYWRCLSSWRSVWSLRSALVRLLTLHRGPLPKNQWKQKSQKCLLAAHLCQYCPLFPCDNCRYNRNNMMFYFSFDFHLLD